MKGVFASLCALALLLVVGAAASAATPNLITNGDAEADQGAPSNTVVVKPTDWTTIGKFTAVQYGASGGFPDAANSTAINGGANFFAGGDGSALSKGAQVVSVSRYRGRIDRGLAHAKLFADLGGYTSQSDYATVTAIFLTRAGKVLGKLTIGPVTYEQRASVTKLLPRSKTGLVPKRTRSIKVVVASVRKEGSYNDGYSDNVSLTIG
jgi:hypothetical protein